jgi:septum formation protein
MGSMLILASRSPRRMELLSCAGIPFIARPADVDESVHEGEDAETYTGRIAEDKALAVHAEPEDVVLGADTTVVIDGQILAKPTDPNDAARMLRLLADRRHDVITAICLCKGKQMVRDWACTRVWFSALSEAEIAEYVASGEPMDKAGAYAIQGLASRFIDRIDGSYSNVVGLPVALVYRYLTGPSAL